MSCGTINTNNTERLLDLGCYHKGLTVQVLQLNKILIDNCPVYCTIYNIILQLPDTKNKEKKNEKRTFKR